MIKVLKKYLNYIVPIIDTKEANSILINKMKVNKRKSLTNVEYRLLMERNNDALKRKDILESKAKTNVAALTIAITLVLNLSSFIKETYDSIPYKFFSWVLIILAFMSVIYMFSAALISIATIVNYNVAFIPSIQEEAQLNKQKIYNCIHNNNNYNLIRNNLIYSSYCLIRNSVICLIIIFTISIFPWAYIG